MKNKFKLKRKDESLSKDTNMYLDIYTKPK